MKVCWIDTETSGLDSQQNGIIQLAYIIDIDNEPVDCGILYNNCKGKAHDPKALEMNQFTPEMIVTFPPSVHMYKRFKEVLKKYVNPYDKDRENKFIIGGFNVDFDVRFLMQLWKDHDDQHLFAFFNFGFIDPSVLARFLQYSGQPVPAGMKLGELAAFFDIVPFGELHDAMVDIKLTREVSRKMMQQFIRTKPRKGV